jgi:hypothetical protein
LLCVAVAARERHISRALRLVNGAGHRTERAGTGVTRSLPRWANRQPPTRAASIGEWGTVFGDAVVETAILGCAPSLPDRPVCAGCAEAVHLREMELMLMKRPPE